MRKLPVKLMILAFVSIVLRIIVTEVQQYQQNDTNVVINNDECIVSVNGELIYKKEIDSVYDEFYDSGIEYKDIVENTIDEILVIQQAKEYGIVCDGTEIEQVLKEYELHYPDEYNKAISVYGIENVKKGQRSRLLYKKVKDYYFENISDNEISEKLIDNFLKEYDLEDQLKQYTYEEIQNSLDEELLQYDFDKWVEHLRKGADIVYY